MTVHGRIYDEYEDMVWDSGEITIPESTRFKYYPALYIGDYGGNVLHIILCIKLRRLKKIQVIKGHYSTYEQFIEIHPSCKLGDAYIVNGSYYYWNETCWANAGSIKGDTGVGSDEESGWKLPVDEIITTNTLPSGVNAGYCVAIITFCYGN